MNAFEAAISGIIEKARETNNIVEGDYIGGNNLYYCGKCHTPKQCAVEFAGIEKVVPCICHCKAEAIKQEEEQRQQRAFFERVQRYRRMGFPESDMGNWTFANDDRSNQKMSDAMQNYVKHFDEFRAKGKGLLLFGNVGTGKTFYAACIANALIDKGIPCLVTNFARIANTVQGLFEGRQEYYDSMNRFTLLLIDDLAAERKTEYMQEIVFNVIDARYRSGLPLIVTTNLTREELQHPADITYQRTFSRLFEMCTPIEIDGKDRRCVALRNDIAEDKRLLGLI